MSAVKAIPGFQILLKLLLKNKLITDEDVSLLQKDPGQDPIRYVVTKNGSDEHEICTKISGALGVSYRDLDLQQKKLVEETFDRPEVSHIPLSKWRERRVVPLKEETRPLELVMANPLDTDTRAYFEFEFGSPIQVSMGSATRIKEILDQREFLDKGLTDIIQVTQPHDDFYEQRESQLKNEDIAAPPIIRLVDRIFSDAISRRASDIHITPEKDKTGVKVRVDGIMEPLLDVPGRLRAPVTSRIKLLAAMDISERRKPQDGRLRIKGVQGTIDLRISTVPSVYGENVVIRILSTNQAKVSLDSVGLREHERKILDSALHASSKIILVSGPTGSGKSSTLYGCLRQLNDGSHTIITVEDPIEYRLDGITQIQVNPKINLSFAEGLRSILRQDPDIIMVGEIRDLETVNMAMQASQTGHLVLSTIHTNSAAASITRLIDLGVPPYLIASSVSTIIAQRLVRTLCQRCKRDATSDELASLNSSLVSVSRMFMPVGCPECRGTGFIGRTGIFSILEVNDQVRDAIRNNLGEEAIEHRAISSGFRTLWESAKEHIESGATTFDEVQRVLGASVAQEMESQIITLPSGDTPKSGAGISRRRLLLVEDDDSTRMILALLFRDQMFEVLEACHGAEGLEKVYEHQPDIIVCDLMMPRMSGLEMVQRIRNDSRLKQMPILMLTAAATEDNELNLMERGADDFVSKTVDSKIMLARVNRLLNR